MTESIRRLPDAELEVMQALWDCETPAARTDIEKVLDEVLFLQNGRIVLSGAVDDIRAEHGKSIDGLFREVFRC